MRAASRGDNYKDLRDSVNAVNLDWFRGFPGEPVSPKASFNN